MSLFNSHATPNTGSGGKSVVPSAQDISGLREQIIANAALALPSVVQSHLMTHEKEQTDLVKPAEIFDVIIQISKDKHGYQAFLVLVGLPGPRKAIVQSAEQSSIQDALFALLIATSDLITQIPGLFMPLNSKNNKESKSLANGACVSESFWNTSVKLIKTKTDFLAGTSGLKI